MMIDFKALAAPFPPEAVSWRVGATSDEKTKGLPLAYIDARDVMDRLDEVCGPAGWQNKYSHANGKTVCDIGIKCGDEWIWKADGAGDSDVEADKGALSDSMKRSAVRWGIGRYLYDVKATWVEIEPMGRSYKIKESAYAYLYGLLDKTAAQVNGLNGLSKEPAKFWSGANLVLVPPSKLLDDASAVLDWRIDAFKKGIQKAPSREHLAKFQVENEVWLKHVDILLVQPLYEACSIRAQQFDDMEKR